MTFDIVSIRNSRGDTEIHKAGCAHLSRLLPYHRAVTGERNGWPATVTCRRDVCEEEYGHAAGSFFEESGMDDYDEFMEMVDSNYLRFAPCTKEMPYE